MTFGEDFGWGASVADSETMIAAYLERGGNFIDTANISPAGQSALALHRRAIREPAPGRRRSGNISCRRRDDDR
jgi:aryl-alcohol dehydrogenase-like predicted oxidoreductase